MNADEVIEDARRRLVDIDDQSFTTADMLSHLNDAMQHFAAATGCCQASYSGTFGGDSQAYEDIGVTRMRMVHGVRYGSSALAQAPVSEFYRWTSPPGDPTGWIWYDEKLWFDAIPAVASAITVLYTYLPDPAASDSDTLDFPAAWRMALVAYVEYRCRAQQRDGGLAERAYGEYMQLLEEAQQIHRATLEALG